MRLMALMLKSSILHLYPQIFCRVMGVSRIPLTNFFLCPNAVCDVTAYVGHDQFEFSDMHLKEWSQ